MTSRASALLGVVVALGIVGGGSVAVSALMPSKSEIRVTHERGTGGIAQVNVQAPPVTMLETGAVGVDEGWVRRTAEAAGIPAPAIRAYGRAVLLIGSDQPECKIGWTTLAGIGWVESHHGTIDGRQLGEDGHASSPILGPQLDGSGEFAAIRATPQGTRWHGNPTWDHAVGPMQFITSTWRRWGADGDGDGVADPNDLDDAAYAAARYLCADGHALDTAVGWSAAVFSYNHSHDYVRQVYAAASSYGDRVS